MSDTAIEALRYSEFPNSSDCISRQAAIDSMCELMRHWFGCDSKDEIREIKRELGKLPSAQQDVPDTNVGDMISRQAAIDEIKTCRFVVDAIEKIRGLPSAQPERKMGKWIYNSPVTMKCDQCGFVIKDWDWHRFKFCPNCDCDMRGEQE